LRISSFDCSTRLSYDLRSPPAANSPPLPPNYLSVATRFMFLGLINGISLIASRSQIRIYQCPFCWLVFTSFFSPLESAGASFFYSYPSFCDPRAFRAVGHPCSFGHNPFAFLAVTPRYSHSTFSRVPTCWNFRALTPPFLVLNGVGLHAFLFPFGQVIFIFACWMILVLVPCSPDFPTLCTLWLVPSKAGFLTSGFSFLIFVLARSPKVSSNHPLFGHTLTVFSLSVLPVCWGSSPILLAFSLFCQLLTFFGPIGFFWTAVPCAVFPFFLWLVVFL